MLDGISFLTRIKNLPSPGKARKRKPLPADRVLSLIVESLRVFLEMMGCTEELRGFPNPQQRLTDLLPGGVGWKSTVFVRILHAHTRHRAAEYYRRSTEIPPGCGEDDAPISAEDMAAT